MAKFKTPGVYIKEISTLPASVAPVATAIPGFVGYTRQQALVDGETQENNTPVRIESLLEFEQIFGGPFSEVFDVTIADPAAGKTKPQITAVANAPGLSPYMLCYHLRMYFENGFISKIPKRVVSLAVSIILLTIIVLIVLGPSFIGSNIMNVKNILIKPATSRLIQTVAENRQPYFTGWARSFGPYYRNIPLMFWLFFLGSRRSLERKISISYCEVFELEKICSCFFNNGNSELFTRTFCWNRSFFVWPTRAIFWQYYWL